MEEETLELIENKKGFTLVELIVVIAIIGILAAVLVPSLTGYITKAKSSVCEMNLSTVNRTLKEATILQSFETKSSFIDAIADVTGMGTIEGGYLTGLCPFGGKYYIVVAEEAEESINWATPFEMHCTHHNKEDKDNVTDPKVDIQTNILDFTFGLKNFYRCSEGHVFRSNLEPSENPTCPEEECHATSVTKVKEDDYKKFVDKKSIAQMGDLIEFCYKEGKLRANYQFHSTSYLGKDFKLAVMNLLGIPTNYKLEFEFFRTGKQDWALFFYCGGNFPSNRDYIDWMKERKKTDDKNKDKLMEGKTQSWNWVKTTTYDFAKYNYDFLPKTSLTLVDKTDANKQALDYAKLKGTWNFSNKENIEVIGYYYSNTTGEIKRGTMQLNKALMDYTTEVDKDGNSKYYPFIRLAFTNYTGDSQTSQKYIWDDATIVRAATTA